MQRSRKVFNKSLATCLTTRFLPWHEVWKEKLQIKPVFGNEMKCNKFRCPLSHVRLSADSFHSVNLYSFDLLGKKNTLTRAITHPETVEKGQFNWDIKIMTSFVVKKNLNFCLQAIHLKRKAITTYFEELYCLKIAECWLKFNYCSHKNTTEFNFFWSLKGQLKAVYFIGNNWPSFF